MKIRFLNLAKSCQEITMEKRVMHVFTYVGGIKSFAADNNSVTKWCLNRPEKAKNKCSKTNRRCEMLG